MTSDLVKRLRLGADYAHDTEPMHEAAARIAELGDEIGRLEAENARLRDAIKPFASHIDKRTCKITMVWEDGDYVSTYTDTLKPSHFFDARSALDKYK